MHAAVEAGVDRNLVRRIHEMTLGWVIAYVDDPAQTYAGAVALNVTSSGKLTTPGGGVRCCSPTRREIRAARSLRARRLSRQRFNRPCLALPHPRRSDRPI
jgi:hypothetical protein